MAGPSKRRSSRQVAKRSKYAEPETDDEDFEFEYHRQRSTVAEEDDYHEKEPIAPAPKRQRTSTTRRKVQTRSKSTQSTLKSAGFRIGKPRRPNSKALSKRTLDDKEESAKVFNGPSDGKKPDWSSLPIRILKDIFIFATLPEGEGIVRSNTSWLFRTARMCRAFAEPALEAYYQSPALYAGQHLHDFLSLLDAPRDQRYVDYKVKVHRMDIDVRGLAYVAPGKPAFDLSSLMRQLPQMHHMEIHHPEHVAPFRPVKVGRWTFDPTHLFQTMDDNNIRLKTWRWSRNLISNDSFVDLYGMMSVAHERKVFAGLQRLVVCGYNVSDSAEPVVEDEGTEAQPMPGLASSIAKLPYLEDLSIITCDVIQSLQLLPNNLHRLELNNCLEITSDIMTAYFSTSASHLEELVLSHNAALSLGFLQGLKSGCHRLQVLKIDLHYYSEKILTDDSEPLYDELLGADEVPTWPSTLRQLEILHAQKWQSEGAQNLFRSLIDSAPELPDLRRLTIHAHINIPWRDRVGFRDQWIKRLRRVYLRKTTEPSKNMGSLKQMRMLADLQGKTIRGPRGTNRDELSLEFSDDDSQVSGRRVSHIRVSPHKSGGDTDHYSDSELSKQQQSSRGPRRSKRVADTHLSQESTPISETEDDAINAEPEAFVQGLCGVVDIRIDNQRPREEQYTEAHFLDSERSGDDDWQEGADEDGDEGYAW